MSGRTVGMIVDGVSEGRLLILLDLNLVLDHEEQRQLAGV